MSTLGGELRRAYCRDTLARAGTPDADQSELLADLGGKLGLGHTPAEIESPTIPMKRADLYEYDGEPIAFLAYLDLKSSPIALCVTLGTGGTARKAELRHGLNMVYRSGGQHRIMVIGRAADAELQGIAATLQARSSEKRK